MKQTAIEWLLGQLPTIDKYDPYYANIINQAKEMEKEQIFDAYITSHISMMSAEQYYYETFKQQEQ
jgi:hypothetical protein